MLIYAFNWAVGYKKPKPAHTHSFDKFSEIEFLLRWQYMGEDCKKEREMWECNKKCSNVHTSLTAKCKIVTKNSLFMFLDTNYCLLFRFFFFWVINCMNYVTLLCLQHLWFRQRSNNYILLMKTRLPFKIGKWKLFCIYVTGYKNNIVKSPVGEHETTVKLVSRNTNQKNLWLFLKIPWGCGAM